MVDLCNCVGRQNATYLSKVWETSTPPKWQQQKQQEVIVASAMLTLMVTLKVFIHADAVIIKRWVRLSIIHYR